MSARGRMHVGVFALVLGSAVAIETASCANSLDLGEGDDAGADTGAPPPSFTPEGESGGDSSAPKPAELCIATVCPWPYATCEMDPYKCTTDLSGDVNNCGACGNGCPTYRAKHLDSSCINGNCELRCSAAQSDFELYKDCNGLIDDGCESNVLDDPENCGSCGYVCPSGERCHAGKCGCPMGLTDCGECADLARDPVNCGACGEVCSYPSDACPQDPPNAYYGCRQGECGKLTCAGGYADCNNDLDKRCASDGCEAEVGVDARNCGWCGNVCKPGDICIEGKCIAPREAGTGCPSGTTPCQGQCVDLLNDVRNCGTCGGVCPALYNATGLCKKGLCEYACVPGWADCNDETADCETNVMTHPGNCGACGNRCDTAAGQPCIAGRCLMTECDGGGLK